MKNSATKGGFALVICILVISCASGLELVTLIREGRQLKVSGRLVSEAQDGGVLILASDGHLWAVQPEEIVSRGSDDRSFLPYDQRQMADLLLRQMSSGFQVHRTAHYIICYNTTKAYAVWTGALYERIYRAFYNYWDRRGFRLQSSDLPLVGLVFQDQNSYQDYAIRELGDATSAVIGYYSLETNRVTTYDLTGWDQGRVVSDRSRTATHVNRLLARPEAERTVATVIHEATHQLVFNSGMLSRFADVPLWLNEGLAMYFETPDLKSAKGWRNIGGVNHLRLQQFKQYVPIRPADSLRTLIQDDNRFRSTGSAQHAYAEAWSLCYYLIRTRPKEMVSYLKSQSGKPPVVETGKEQRLQEFQAAFGASMLELDGAMVRYMTRQQ